MPDFQARVQNGGGWKQTIWGTLRGILIHQTKKHEKTHIAAPGYTQTILTRVTNTKLIDESCCPFILLI